ncbi:MAG: sigma 54-interacting transcriptional regulator [Thermoanaerobaculia bacterium]|nr:sigma 54-interacting transcriptional regulator [Thermoanaerobaculia bacterium]
MNDETKPAAASERRPVPSAELVIYATGVGRRPLPAKDEVVVGRGVECDVVLADPSVSRRHCRLRRASGGWWLEDLGSQSGTRVSGEPITAPVALENGTWFELGDSHIQFAAVMENTGVPCPALSGDPRRDAFLLAELARAGESFARAETHDEILVAVIDHALRVVGAERGVIFLAGEGDSLAAAVARDTGGRELALDELLTRSLPRRALASNQPVVVADTESQEPLGEWPESLLAGGRRSVVCLPIPAARGAVIGLDSARPVPSFGAGELAILSTLALHAGLALDRAVEAARAAETRRHLERENARLRVSLGVAPLGTSPAFVRALDQIRRLAPSNATVCLTGETGTGKEVLARYLHRSSPRAERPFVVVDCGALPASLIESELFGHERGAFTGAAQARSGRLREAAGGTVFLDEIGELPLELQPRLLRFLQERTVQPIGGRATAVDVRVICATHRDLEEQVARGELRQDLYFRLAVVSVVVPPLRERGEDVLVLAEAVLRAQGGESSPARLGHDARRALLEHPWPGNVRELEHRVQRALWLAPCAYVTAADLGLAEASTASPLAPDDALPSLPEARALANDRFERRYLEEVLRRTRGSVSEAARHAGVSRQLIHTLLQRHQIDRARFR